VPSVPRRRPRPDFDPWGERRLRGRST
jgi:hypothetical protein